MSEGATLLAILALAVALLAVLGRGRTAARSRRADELARQRQGTRVTGPQGEPAARLAYQDLELIVGFDQGPGGELTTLAVAVAERLPVDGSVHVLRQGPPRVDRLGDAERAPGTGDAAFDKAFRIEADEAARCVLFRWLDAPARELVRELAQRQGKAVEPVLELDPVRAQVRSWLPGMVETDAELDTACEILARLTRRLLGRPAYRPVEAPLRV